MVKKILIALLAIILALAALVLGFFGYLTITEYRPRPVDPVGISGNSVMKALPSGGSLRIMSWNIGYAGLGKDADFFMDGGTGVASADEATVRKNLSGLSSFVAETGADFTLLQEVDSGSSRTYFIDERESFSGLNTAYALNYSCNFVPYPLPPIGTVHSGIMTLSGYTVTEANRIALPSPFTWPVSTANLKRCLLVSRIPIDGGDKELVLINLHLEAYDDGEGKAAQTAMLKEIMEAEYAKGNLVIAGGDFNQSFPEALTAYPIKDAELWTPGILSDSDLSEGWHFAYDVSVPSCRLLNQPYDPSSPATQYYTIDGFIISPNVTLKSVETVDRAFEHTDHNPVLMEIEY